MQVFHTNMFVTRGHLKCLSRCSNLCQVSVISRLQWLQPPLQSGQLLMLQHRHRRQAQGQRCADNWGQRGEATVRRRALTVGHAGVRTWWRSVRGHEIQQRERMWRRVLQVRERLLDQLVRGFSFWGHIERYGMEGFAYLCFIRNGLQLIVLCDRSTTVKK